MVKFANSLKEGGVEVIQEKPEGGGKLTGRIFGALFDHNQQQQGALAPALARKRPEAPRAPAWGKFEYRQQAAGTDGAGHDDAANTFGIGITEENFHQLEQQWGIHDLKEDPADSDAGPSGSGKIGGSVYTPSFDESKVSDKRAVAVGFGCTYIAGNSSVVMVNDLGQLPSVDGGGGGKAWGGVGGGDGGGDGGGGGGDDGHNLGVRRESGVNNVDRGRSFTPSLSMYAPPEETSDQRKYSRATAGIPEGTPEVVSTAVTRREQAPQNTEAPAFFGAVDSSFNELFPSSARLHGVAAGSHSYGGDGAGTARAAEHAGATDLSRGAGPATSGEGIAFAETSTALEEANSAEFTLPLGPLGGAGPFTSAGGAAVCKTPIELEEIDFAERMDLSSPSRNAGPAVSGGVAAVCETAIKREETDLDECALPPSPTSGAGPAKKGGSAALSDTPITLEELNSSELTLLPSPSSGAGPALSDGGASFYETLIGLDGVDLHERTDPVSPSRDTGLATSGECNPALGTPFESEEVNSTEIRSPANPSRHARSAMSGGGSAFQETSTTREEVESTECMASVSSSRDAGPPMSNTGTPSRGSKTVEAEVNLETCAGWLFSSACGHHTEKGGRADDEPASVAGAPDAPPPAAPTADGKTIRSDHGTARDGSVAAASTGTKGAPSAGGYTLRSTTAFLQRTAGKFAASFFAMSSGSATSTASGPEDNNTGESKGTTWREFPASVPRDKRLWYHASILAPMSTHPV